MGRDGNPPIFLTACRGIGRIKALDSGPLGFAPQEMDKVKRENRFEEFPAIELIVVSPSNLLPPL
jgi:hypothetical protein